MEDEKKCKIYENGYIYVIRPINTDEESPTVYYGSTISTPRHRFSQHKTDFVLFNKGNREYRTVYEIFKKYGCENIELVPIKTCQNITKRELENIEFSEYISKYPCVNKQGKHGISYNGTRSDYVKKYNEIKKIMINQNIQKITV
jgi:hypothetical protein